jgi:hypothetical protein
MHLGIFLGMVEVRVMYRGKEGSKEGMKDKGK